MSFIQPPFWARPRARSLARAVSQPVTPTLAIASSSVANPTVITTTTPHYLWTGDTVLISGHTSTPTINGSRVVTVIDATSFSIPVNVTVGGGAGGTVVATSLVEPLTLAEGKLRAGLDWVDGDDRDGLMRNFLTSARMKVEHDTGLAIRLQLRDVLVDDLDGFGFGWPAHTFPLQAVDAITWTDADGVAHVVDPATYQIEPLSGRIALVPGSVWPAGEYRALAPWTVRTASGYASIGQIPAPLIHAIGMLTAHFATVGRDVAITGTIVNLVPLGYDDAIQPYRLEVLA